MLSDDQIVAELKKRDILIARRTVAKYRESLGIASSVDRRRAKALRRDERRWRNGPPPSRRRGRALLGDRWSRSTIS